jgi:integrase
MGNGIVKYNEQNIETMARTIARARPGLADLTHDQLEQIARIVITQRLTNELNQKVNIADIDLKVEKGVFLKQVGHCGSQGTRGVYLRAIRKLENYCLKMNINILLMTYKEADDFIYSLEGASSTKRLVVAAISSFYTFLERRYEAIRNPVRGTKARPPKKAVKELVVPDDDDMIFILDKLPELERLAVFIMADRGLRVGALKNLKIWGTHYTTTSKGKNIEGEFSDTVLMQIRTSELNNKTPFENISTNALKLRIYRSTKKLYEQGIIKGAYSAHDFRHYFAIAQYKQDKDIYKLSQLLDHTSIAVTENYLRGLKIVK